MKLKEIFKVVFSIVMAVFIMSVSMGMNISKMKCDEDGSVYLGTEVPSCSEEYEVVCNKEQEKVTCCMIEIQKSCCPETNDESCASSTQNIHYDFETILTVLELDFSEKASLLSFFNSYESNSYFVKVNNYFSGIPPPKLNKPILAKIQSFLI
ncbi:hypothetical protein OAB72_00760 [Flavobacteriales bacterium]|jgi:hypothetical protein|nr:hypothetical protein [Flavobacteriales bacterium]